MKHTHEVEYDGKWYPLVFITPEPDAAGDFAAVYLHQGGEYFTTYFPASYRDRRIRPIATPKEPELPEGVTLWDCVEAHSQRGGVVVIRIDGDLAGHATEAEFDHGNGCVGYFGYRHPVANLARYAAVFPALAELRDKVRAGRAAKPDDAPRMWTRAEIEAIAKGVGK